MTCSAWFLSATSYTRKLKPWTFLLSETGYQVRTSRNREGKGSFTKRNGAYVGEKWYATLKRKQWGECVKRLLCFRIALLGLISFLHCQIDLLRNLSSCNFILESSNHKSSSCREQRSKCEVLTTGSKASLRGILPIFERNHAQHSRGTNERGASESHWLQLVLVLTVHWWPTPVSVGGLLVNQWTHSVPKCYNVRRYVLEIETTNFMNSTHSWLLWTSTKLT